MRSTAIGFAAAALLCAAAAGDAAAGMKTPLWGASSHEFSLWPVLYVGHGGFSIPGMQLTEDSFSIPFIHCRSRPDKRFDMTPVYHHEEGEEGVALGPRRETVNDGMQGVANTIYDLITVVTNTRQLVSDDNEGYETYREYGDPELKIPGHEAPILLKEEPAPKP